LVSLAVSSPADTADPHPVLLVRGRADTGASTSVIPRRGAPHRPGSGGPRLAP